MESSGSSDCIEMPAYRQHLILYTLVAAALICVAFLLIYYADGVEHFALHSFACLLEFVFIVFHDDDRAITASNDHIVVLKHSGCRFSLTETEKGHDGQAPLSQHVVVQWNNLSELIKTVFAWQARRCSGNSVRRSEIVVACETWPEHMDVTDSNECQLPKRAIIQLRERLGSV